LKKILKDRKKRHLEKKTNLTSRQTHRRAEKEGRRRRSINQGASFGWNPIKQKTDSWRERERVRNQKLAKREKGLERKVKNSESPEPKYRERGERV